MMPIISVVLLFVLGVVLGFRLAGLMRGPVATQPRDARGRFVTRPPQ
jgi:hypothetical protein